jgi:hypothetical protein
MNWAKTAQNVQSLLRRQNGLTVDFEWKGKMHTGIRTFLHKEIVNSDAGLAGYYSFSLLCPYDEFSTNKPESRTDKVSIDGVEFRVLAVEEDAVRATLKLHLGDVMA